MLVEVGCGTRKGHVSRIDSAVSNETVEGRVVMMYGGKMFLDMEKFHGRVRQWDEHEKLLCISNYLIAKLRAF